MAEAASYRKLEHNADAESEAELEDVTWTQPANNRPRERTFAWLRMGVEVALVLVIIALTAGLVSPKADGRRGPNDPKRDCMVGFVDRVFMNDSWFANEDALIDSNKTHETLSHWLPLSSKGRGYVRIPPEERDTMEGPPYLMNPMHRPGLSETYMLSGLHQLHCLSTIFASYARMRQGQDESELGYHIAHCFDYLRQGILCAGDSTLEGNNSATYPGVEIPWGTSHRCVDWEAMVEFADERTIWPFPSVIDIL